MKQKIENRTKQKMENRCSWNDFANYYKKQKTIIIDILKNLPEGAKAIEKQYLLVIF